MRVDGLGKRFAIRSGLLSRKIGEVRAVSEVSFDIRAGETLGLVGESGCGKSTLGQTLVGLHRPEEGAVRFALDDGGEIDPARADRAQRRRLRTGVRLVFQDPSGSLNPRLTVRQIIGEVLEVNTGMRRARSMRGSRSCWRRSGSIRPMPPATRTPSAAASGSASPSPGRWPRRRSW